MKKEKKKIRIGLRLKLNITLIVGIILLVIGLLTITYIFYVKKVNSLYFQRAEQESDAVAYGFVQDIPLAYYVDLIYDEEFQEVRRKAIEANDDKIIEDWMRSRPPIYSYVDSRDKEEAEIDGNALKYSYYDEYESFRYYLENAKKTFGLKSVYLQYVKDGVTYNLMDPDESLTQIGAIEDPIKEFDKYDDNESIKATIYQYKGEWLCTASEVVEDFKGDDNIVAGHVCIDLDMNDVFEDRKWFLVNSATFIIILTFLVILISLLLTRKFVTRPLKLLSKGTMEFDIDDESFSVDDVINLPINSNDEIGDLYSEIQSMQRRIIAGAEKITKITAERERVNTELNMATRIQSSMIPSKFPAFPDREEFDLYASMDPAKEVGGDFYDFFMIDEDHLFILIADVSGKGVPAALFMMSTKILINYRAKKGGSPAEILSDVNAQIYKDNKAMMFVTVWMGILDIRTGNLKCTNAGHEFPFIRSKDGKFRVYHDDHSGMVGVRANMVYKDYELTLEKGDAVFVYTDGIPEAINASEEMYSMERLEECLNNLSDKSPTDIINGVRSSVDSFVDGATQFDDLTMLCVEYKN